ncbi:hypothetical protein HQ529_02220 [Candidatus Woesearchaeota archaeon]|nr:hypothetical protein [Candidatus Woesearchaeota archaeon]
MSRLKQKIGKGVVFSLITLMLGGSEKKCEYIPRYSTNVHPKSIEWVDENIERIAKEQEEKLGIKYPYLPEIKFEQHPDKSLGMYYEPYINTLILVLPQYAHFNPSEIEEYLDHELGHAYTDILNEIKGNASWPTSQKGIKYYTQRLIFEGIAEYFRKQMKENTEDNFDDNYWPKTLGEFVEKMNFEDKKIIYDGGHSIVKPVLDHMGVEEGILFLIKNIPRKKDLGNIPQYQQRLYEKANIIS